MEKPCVTVCNSAIVKTYKFDPTSDIDKSSGDITPELLRSENDSRWIDLCFDAIFFGRVLWPDPVNLPKQPEKSLDMSINNG